MLNFEELASFCKRRGFVYQSSSAYGGLQGFFDYGPLGIELKNNIKKHWWKNNVYLRSDVYGLDSATVLKDLVLKYSQHSTTFTDNLIDCKNCKSRFRDDEFNGSDCPKCKSKNLSDLRAFNLMMNVNLGPTGEETGFLRPETAQGIFVNFKNVTDSFSPKIPFGIAQIGKAYRNEITPRHFLFRMREFEQMELEYFINPEDEDYFFNYWIEERLKWWKEIGVENIELKHQLSNELAHYSKATTDIVFKFHHGWEEIEGIANRTDYDLGSHTKNQNEFGLQSNVMKNDDSVVKLSYTSAEKTFVPYNIESSAGLDRAFLAVIASAYVQEETRIVLKLKPFLAPFKVAVIPIVKNNEKIVEYAKNIFEKLKKSNILPVIFENTGNIGKAYKKHDEIGTPFAITIDFDTLENDTMTIRFRDSMKQERLNFQEILSLILKNIN